MRVGIFQAVSVWGSLLVMLGIASAQTTEAPKPTTANPKVSMVTNKGVIVIELYPQKAPITVENFVKLTKKKFYDGLAFHRYVEGFVIQGGDPQGDGSGGPGYTIKDEHRNGLTHIKGAVAMARTQAPNSAGSQFYICLEAAPFLDNQYTVFGQVISGMDVVMQLRQGDKMNKVVINDK